MPSTLMMWDKIHKGKKSSKARQKAVKKYRKREKESEAAKKKMGVREYSKSQEAANKAKKNMEKYKKRDREAEAAKKKLGSPSRKKQQMKKAKKANLILADAEETTEPGAMDDDAKERIKRRKKALEEAAG